MPRASRLGESLKKKYDAEIELVAGSGGVFEVQVNGELIFSKRSLNRFPEENELFSLISRMDQ